MADAGQDSAASTGGLADAGTTGDLDATRSLLATAEAQNEAEMTNPEGMKRVKPRKKGQPWDGRVSSLTLEEYREMKWGKDASFNATKRKGVSYTMRTKNDIKPKTNAGAVLSSNVAAAFDASKPIAPSYSMGSIMPPSIYEKSPGPAQYLQQCTMQTRKYPLSRLGHKHTGYKFGSELQRPLPRNAKNPAPGDYDQEAFKKSAAIRTMPAYTSQGREAWKDPTCAPGPNPSTYDCSNKFRVGKDTPIRFSIALPDPKPLPGRGAMSFIGPGAPDYQEMGANGEKNKARVDMLKGKAAQWKFSKDVRGLDPMD